MKLESGFRAMWFNYGSTHGYTERNDLEKCNNIKEIQPMPELPDFKITFY